MEFKAAVFTTESTTTDQSAGITTGDLPSTTTTRVEIRVELQRLALSLALDGVADSQHGHGQHAPSRSDGQLPAIHSERGAGTSSARDGFLHRPSDQLPQIAQEKFGSIRDSIDKAVDPRQLTHQAVMMDRDVVAVVKREATRELRSPDVKQREAPEEPRPERSLAKEKGELKPSESSPSKEQKETLPTHKHAPKEPSVEPRIVDKPVQEASPQTHARGEVPQRVQTTRDQETPKRSELIQEPTRDPATTPTIPASQQPPLIETTRAQVNPSMPVEDARMVVLDKINTLREVVQTAPVIAETRAPTFSRSYTESTTIEPAAQNSASRTSDQPRPSDPRREVNPPPFIPSSTTASDKTVSPQQSTDTSNRSTISAHEQQRAIQLLDGLEKITSQLMSMTTLRALDRALETVCLSVVAGGFLGAQGAAYIVRETLTATNEIIARIRDMMGIPTTLSKELRTVQESLDQLEKQCLDRDFEKVNSAAGFVGDITGRIQLFGSGLPVQGITVDGGSLGTCITNSFGEFRFDNIPLDTGYEITARDANYTFFPSSFVGTVATTNQLIFSATKVS
jgi:hypothetical protein